MTNQSKCLGCGATKQTENKEKIGYSLNLSHDYCQDCFRLANYGESVKHVHPEKYLDIKNGSLVLVIQSVMQLDMLFSLPVHRIQPDAKYIYVINQMDLLQKSTNLDYLYNNIIRLAKKNNVSFEDLIFMSALNSDDINNLKEYLLNQNIKDIYLFGFQNSGKTTILKGLTNNKTALNINKAGLTQEVIYEDLEGKTIYDMPGTYVEGYISDYLAFDQYRKLLPKKPIKPKVYQLKKTQKLLINDFIEIDFKGADICNLVLYLSEHNKLTKYNLANTNNYLNEEFEYVTKSFKTLVNKTQITIADIAFIQTTDNCIINIKYPKKMHLTVMESLIK